MNNYQDNFYNIVSNFQFEGKFLYAQPCGSGHINDTYIAYFQNNNEKKRRYIMQRINKKIFSNIDALMSNIQMVIDHMQKKILEKNGDTSREALTLIPTITNSNYWYDSDKDEYWRAYIFVEKSVTYQRVTEKKNLYYAAKGFGKFQNYLSDFSVDQLNDILPNFHNTIFRFSEFEKAMQNDIVGRAATVQNEIDFALKRKSDACILVELINEGKIPIRVTHNDAKLNNVMFDESSGKDLCVIDYDTVMPGSTLYDFGDSIRFGANSSFEDEIDLSKVYLDLELFEEYVKGYLEEADLTPCELRNLSLSAKIMTFENGIRFLTDYLNGDIYFKTSRIDHNLDRCRVQFKLVKDIESNLEQMDSIIKRYSVNF